MNISTAPERGSAWRCARKLNASHQAPVMAMERRSENRLPFSSVTGTRSTSRRLMPAA